MKPNILVLALAASASLCLSACATSQLPIPPDQLAAAAQTIAPSIALVAKQDADAGYIDQDTAQKIGDFADAAVIGAAAVQGASAACTAAGTDKQACAIAALHQVETAGEQLLGNPSVAKLIGAAAGPRVAAALKAFHTALLAAEDAKTAASATDQQAKLIAANAALLQLNFAILQGIQAAR